MEEEPIKLLGEAVSLTAIIGTIVGLLPNLAALCAIFWYGVLTYDRFKKKKKEDEANTD